ncbi:unnamed protein product [Closterium sp. NIES-53]
MYVRSGRHHDEVSVRSVIPGNPHLFSRHLGHVSSALHQHWRLLCLTGWPASGAAPQLVAWHVSPRLSASLPLAAGHGTGRTGDPPLAASVMPGVHTSAPNPTLPSLRVSYPPNFLSWSLPVRSFSPAPQHACSSTSSSDSERNGGGRRSVTGTHVSTTNSADVSTPATRTSERGTT